MPLLARTVTTALSIDVRPGAIEGLAPLLRDGRISGGGKVAIVIGPGHGATLAEGLAEQLPHATIEVVEGGSLEAAIGLMSSLRGDFFDAVVGIGGGRTLDVAKYAASMLGLPFVSVATTLTHDGVASPVASLVSQGRKASYGVNVPIAVVVDIDQVRTAPTEHLVSGVGDVLSNLSAIADWELARQETGERVDGMAVSVARSAAEALIEVQPGSDRFLTVLADTLILSGLAMTMAGTSRPCSGACHEISHALDAYHGSPGLHGAQVALGALFASWLRAQNDIDDGGLFPRLDVALAVHGLPRTPRELGISRDTFLSAVVQAPRTRPDRFTVLEHVAASPARTEELVDAFIETVDR